MNVFADYKAHVKDDKMIIQAMKMDPQNAAKNIPAAILATKAKSLKDMKEHQEGLIKEGISQERVAEVVENAKKLNGLNL